MLLTLIELERIEMNAEEPEFVFTVPEFILPHTKYCPKFKLKLVYLLCDEIESIVKISVSASPPLKTEGNEFTSEDKSLFGINLVNEYIYI